MILPCAHNSVPCRIAQHSMVRALAVTSPSAGGCHRQRQALNTAAQLSQGQ